VVLAPETVRSYIDSIFDPSATTLPRLECPALDHLRYEPLKATRHQTGEPRVKYFFALDLRQCLELLPRLLGSIVEAIRFLGPDHCALSIVGGNSPDGTDDVLTALTPALQAIHLASYTFQTAELNSSSESRIEILAMLRNIALEPLFRPEHPLSADVSEDATVLFINDVAACPEDILELVLQRRNLGADLVCAFDWSNPFDDGGPTFYDVWVSRTMKGNWFFNIPPDTGGWEHAHDLFWNDPATRARFDALLPFQVFSCWNGATAFGAKPILDGLRFRASNEEAHECFQGEVQLLCKDMWHRGFGKIAVVPTVNLEYTNEKGKKVKELKGYTSDLVRGKTEEEMSIDWVTQPPEKVLCSPDFHRQSWRVWNETLDLGSELQ
jgi:alpha-1,3-mannosyltransferase